MPLTIRFKRLESDAKIPDQAYEGDAGFDLYAAEDVELKHAERKKVRTGIAMAIPEGHVGLIWDKSSVGINRGVTTLGGVIDSGYRGEITVGIVNLSGEKQIFQKGDKLAQILIQKYECFALQEVDRLNETERGAKGFGSSGK